MDKRRGHAVRSGGQVGRGPEADGGRSGLAGGGRSPRAVRAEVGALIGRHGYTDYKWIKPGDIVVAEWVRMKCLFGCGEYGRKACCPPNVPSVAECRQFFNDYKVGVVFHFARSVAKPQERHAWSRGVNQGLSRLEREIFLAGYHKVFLLFMDSCTLCAACPGGRGECRKPADARPSPESLAVDVYSTVRRYGFPIQVLADYSETMNRYAFLLVE